MDYSTSGFPALHCLPAFVQTPVYWVGDAIQPSHSLLPHSPLALSLSQHQGFVFFFFSNSQLFASGRPSFGASILWHLTFFMVQLSHLYTTAGKGVAWTIQIFVSKVMSLLFNMLSCFVIAFLPRSKRLFNFVAAVTICSDFRAQENKVCHCFHFPPSICHEMMGLDVTI